MLSVSESGYSNDDLALEWLKHFDRCTEYVRSGAYRMLILDGWRSNFEYNFIKYAARRKIVLFGLPPHTTHLMQPLDVAVFQPCKHWHGEIIDRELRTGASTFTKYDFLANLKEMREKTFKEHTIMSAWRLTGLYPFNPSIVLDKIKPPLDRTPSLSPEPTAHKTPKKGSQVTREGQDLIQLLQNGAEIEPQLKRRLLSYIKGSIAVTLEGEQVRRDLNATRTGIQRRQSRPTSQRHVFKGGSISVYNARFKSQEKRDEIRYRRDAKSARMNMQQANEAREQGQRAFPLAGMYEIDYCLSPGKSSTINGDNVDDDDNNDNNDNEEEEEEEYFETRVSKPAKRVLFTQETRLHQDEEVSGRATKAAKPSPQPPKAAGIPPNLLGRWRINN